MTVTIPPEQRPARWATILNDLNNQLNDEPKEFIRLAYNQRGTSLKNIIASVTGGKLSGSRAAQSGADFYNKCFLGQQWEEEDCVLKLKEYVIGVGGTIGSVETPSNVKLIEIDSPVIPKQPNNETTGLLQLWQMHLEMLTVPVKSTDPAETTALRGVQELLLQKTNAFLTEQKKQWSDVMESHKNRMMEKEQKKLKEAEEYLQNTQLEMQRKKEAEEMAKKNAEIEQMRQTITIMLAANQANQVPFAYTFPPNNGGTPQ
jgi:hypothetical protein